MTRASLGAWGEAVARDHLISHGYVVRDVNWRCPEGEIDLIAEIEDTLVFVEVKTRRGTGYGAPQEAVGPRKARHLVLAASRYLEQHHLTDIDLRIDVIAITAGPGPQVLNLEHFSNAVEGRLP